MSEELESPFAVLDTVGEETGDSTEATPAEVTTEEAPAEEAKPESTEGEEKKAEETAKPDAEPETKDGEKKAEAEAEEPEPIEGEPPKLKEFIAKHKLSGEEKRWVKNLTYQNKAYQEVFPDIREARDFRTAFPASEDWKGAAQTRDAFFNASRDFEQNPTAFRDGLKSTNAAAYQRVVEAIAQDIPTVAPQARLELVSDGIQSVFTSLKAEAARNGVAWDQVTAKEIEDRIFSAEHATPEDPRVAQILEENRKLKAAQQGETQKNVSAIVTVLDQRVTSTVNAEVKQYIDLYAGDGFTEAAKAKIVADLSARVVHSYRNTQSNNHAKKAVIDALARNQMRPEDAVASLAARARPELKRLGPDVIRNWTEVIIGANKKAVQKAQTAKVEKVSATRDVPQMATTSKSEVQRVMEKQPKGARFDWGALFTP